MHRLTYALTIILAYSSEDALATQMMAALAILILRNVSICVRILSASVSEKGSPLHLKHDYFSAGNLALVRLKKW